MSKVKRFIAACLPTLAIDHDSLAVPKAKFRI